MRKFLNRRTVLRGMLGGSLLSLALPTLNAMLDEHGEAYADGSGFPRRFGWWFFGNGALPDLWTPAGSGPDWEPSPLLAPLADVKDEITVISGLKVYMPNDVPHASGPAGILTGRRLGVVGDNFGNSALGASTLDQVIADQVGSETLFKSIEVAVERSDDSLSYSSAGQANPPEYSPAALFDRLFGAGFVAPGEDPIVDPKLGLRRSVLDAISADAQALNKRLGVADKQRLEQHLDNIRTLEKKLAKLEEDPPNLASCVKPGAPLAEYPDENGSPQMSAIHRVMADIMAMSLACDQTRVFSVQFSRALSGVLYPGAAEGHHNLTHNEGGDQPTVQAVIKFIMEEFAYFVKALAAVPEGDGTLLDHCAVLCFSDTSYGKSHAIDNYPLLLAGTADGALKKGMHYKSPAAENASKLGFTLLRAMGVPVTEFGADEGLVTQGLDDIEV